MWIVGILRIHLRQVAALPRAPPRGRAPTWVSGRHLEPVAALPRAPPPGGRRPAPQGVRTPKCLAQLRCGDDRIARRQALHLRHKMYQCGNIDRRAIASPPPFAPRPSPTLTAPQLRPLLRAARPPRGRARPRPPRRQQGRSPPSPFITGAARRSRVLHVHARRDGRRHDVL